ncbi:NfeD family protein [Propionicimonas sp.]|uniref:NfeD family protein n=1 Tax=Propionicimonas sp. TaxID=1955623 RepID=UPI0039E285FF
MTTLYVIGTVAVVLGAIGLLVDGALDFVPDSEWFSVTGLAAGVAVYAFTTGILVGTGLPLGVASLPGALAALVVMVGASWLIYRLRNSGTEHDTSASRMIGLGGTVITPTGPGLTGEIDLVLAGERHRMNALSDDDIPAGGRAEVVDVVSPTCVRIIQLR